MDERSSSSTFSTDSMTTEINNTPVSGFIDHTAVDDDELMQCDDVLDEEELTCLSIHTDMSSEGVSLLSGSWSCHNDSDISEVITSFDQDINEREPQDWLSDQRRVQDLPPVILLPPPETAITEAAKMLVSLVVDKVEKALDDTGSEKPLQGERSEWKRLKKKVHPAYPAQDDVGWSATTELTFVTTEESKQGSRGFQGIANITSFSAAVRADMKSTQQELEDCMADEDQAGVEDTKAKKSNCFSSFFNNIFSKKNEKKMKVASEENHFQWPSFWMHVVLV
ncbi:hypothetical protein D5F01_LYC19361 [Larimichthys crocea]|uniref:Uncharacterized protein n=1 Tax=Larimichthys crocea TaxID=215358 RepID=A0A6G0HSH5_LARCR|nr:hypothetical protein D5F01_LYC19361 [Larimichthys crocea]